MTNFDFDREAFPGENLTRLDPNSRPTWCISGDFTGAAKLAGLMDLGLRDWRYLPLTDAAPRAALIDHDIGVQAGHRLIAAYAREAAQEIDFRAAVSAPWGILTIAPHRDADDTTKAALDALSARVGLVQATTCGVCAMAGKAYEHGVVRCPRHWPTPLR